MLGDLRSFCVQSTKDLDGLAAALEEEQQESHSAPDSDSPIRVADSETHTDDDEIDGELTELNRKTF
jgi:hypothetical protein